MDGYMIIAVRVVIAGIFESDHSDQTQPPAWLLQTTAEKEKNIFALEEPISWFTLEFSVILY